MTSPFYPITTSSGEPARNQWVFPSMDSYHVIATLSLEGRIYDYRPELVPARITPLLVDAMERAEFGGLLRRIREPQISVTRWI